MRMYVCTKESNVHTEYKNCSVIENILRGSFLKKIGQLIVIEKAFDQIKHPSG